MNRCIGDTTINIPKPAMWHSRVRLLNAKSRPQKSSLYLRGIPTLWLSKYQLVRSIDWGIKWTLHHLLQCNKSICRELLRNLEQYTINSIVYSIAFQKSHKRIFIKKASLLCYKYFFQALIALITHLLKIKGLQDIGQIWSIMNSSQGY